jgi:hypothetical protein
MNYEIDDFVGIFHNVLDERYCDDLVQYYENLNQLNKTTNRQRYSGVSSSSIQNDLYYMIDEFDPVFIKKNYSILGIFGQQVFECYKLYREKYGTLNNFSAHSISSDIKIQKIKPSEGYHIWHCETESPSHNDRILLIIAYLNDVEEGGETEFLYQSKRLNPKKGSILLCPAGFTHTHRGNPPLKGTKYIMNGWLTFTEKI